VKYWQSKGLRPGLRQKREDASLECELIYRRSWKSQADARTALLTWIEGWYNLRRRHSGLNYLSPINFERKQNEQEDRALEHGLPTASAGDNPTRHYLWVEWG
jgi:putative transposase